jgi:hypothetical protein
MLNGLRLEGVYASGTEGDFYVEFRLSRAFPPGYAREATTELTPLGNTDYGDINQAASFSTPVSQFQTRGPACYYQSLTGNLDATTGDLVQFVLTFEASYSSASAANTLRAEVRLTGAIPPDFYISSKGVGPAVQDIDGAYARALGCDPDAPGEVSDIEYCDLVATRSPRLGPHPQPNATAACPRAPTEPGPAYPQYVGPSS